MILITDATQDYVLTSRGSRAMPIDRTPGESMQDQRGGAAKTGADVGGCHGAGARPYDGDVTASDARAAAGQTAAGQPAAGQTAAGQTGGHAHPAVQAEPLTRT